MLIPQVVGLTAAAASGAAAVASHVASPFAAMLGQAAGVAPSAPAPAATQQSAASALSAFNGQLQSLFSAEGVDTSQPIVLQSDGQGGLELANSHPDSLKIKAILAENPNLATQFAAVEQAYQSLQAASLTAPSATGVFSVTISGSQAQAGFS